MSSILLFVYGTLKRGCRGHGWLAGQEWMGSAKTLPHYRLHDSGCYPCLVRDLEHGVLIHGELWRVLSNDLKRLDAYEGAPELFRRDRIEVEGIDELVFAYFFEGDVSKYADCGTEWRS